MKVAPIGAFGAMAFTIGAYGVGSLVQLGQLMLCFYITCILFVLIVLGGIARAHGFSILRFIRYIREELLIVLGTSFFRVGSAADDRQDGEARLQQVGGRPGDSHRLLLQPRRHLDYLTMAGGVHRPGHRYADGHHPPDHPAAGAADRFRAPPAFRQRPSVLAATLSAVGYLPVAGLALIPGIDASCRSSAR